MSEHDKEKLHGSVLFGILNYDGDVKIAKWGKASRRDPIYIIEYGKIHSAIYIKYRKERAEWVFNFNISELKQIRALRREFVDRVFICLVCLDRICLINVDEFNWLTEDQQNNSKSVTVKRDYGAQFSVETSEKRTLVPAKSFPRRLFD